MGSGYSSEEEQETQDQKPSILLGAEEEEPDVIATDFGGSREQGDGMEKEEEQPVQTYEDQHLSKTPLLLDIQEKEV